jgi:hypothetical protein
MQFKHLPADCGQGGLPGLDIVPHHRIGTIPRKRYFVDMYADSLGGDEPYSSVSGKYVVVEDVAIGGLAAARRGL